MSRTVAFGNRRVDIAWTWADRVAEFVNPRGAIDRMRSRAVMALVGGYEGGKRDKRQTRNWRPLAKNVNETNSADLPDLRERSRDLVRNVPIATGAVNTLVTNVIGDGLVVQPAIDREVLKMEETAAIEWQKAAQREFLLWADDCDLTGRLNFDEMQALVFRSVVESGDIFVARRRYDSGISPYKLKLLAIEADRVCNTNKAANTVGQIDGVLLDKIGRPVGYNIANHHPDDQTIGLERSWKVYSPGMTITGQPLILHLYHMLRPDQVRGVPYLAPVIETIKQLGQYAEAEINAAVVSAFFTAFVTRETITDDGDNAFLGDPSSTSNIDPNSEIQLGNGAIVDLAAGEDVKFANPTRPNAAFDGFYNSIVKNIGTALNIPYEVLIQSFQASYSASRAALEMAWQFFNERRTWFTWKFCQPVYEWVITEAILEGRLAAPGFLTDPILRKAWLGAIWVSTSARISLDPEKEANAWAKHLEMRTTSRHIIAMEYAARNYDDIHSQLVREDEKAKEDGIGALPTDPNNPNDPNKAKEPDKKEPGKKDGEDKKENGNDVNSKAFELLAQATLINAEAAKISAEKPPVAVHMPEIKVQEIKVIAETPAPIVNVKAPNVTVEAAQIVVPPAIVNVTTPQPEARKRELSEVKYDDQGRIVSAKSIET